MQNALYQRSIKKYTSCIVATSCIVSVIYCMHYALYVSCIKIIMHLIQGVSKKKVQPQKVLSSVKFRYMRTFLYVTTFNSNNFDYIIKGTFTQLTTQLLRFIDNCHTRSQLTNSTQSISASTEELGPLVALFFLFYALNINQGSRKKNFRFLTFSKRGRGSLENPN